MQICAYYTSSIDREPRSINWGKDTCQNLDFWYEDLTLDRSRCTRNGWFNRSESLETRFDSDLMRVMMFWLTKKHARSTEPRVKKPMVEMKMLNQPSYSNINLKAYLKASNQRESSKLISSSFQRLWGMLRVIVRWVSLVVLAQKWASSAQRKEVLEDKILGGIKLSLFS